MKPFLTARFRDRKESERPGGDVGVQAECVEGEQPKRNGEIKQDARKCNVGYRRHHHQT